MNVKIRLRRKYSKEEIFKSLSEILSSQVEKDEKRKEYFITKNNNRYIFDLRVTDMIFEDEEFFEFDSLNLDSFEAVEEINISLFSSFIKEKNINDMYSVIDEIEKKIISDLNCVSFFNIMIKSSINNKVKEKLNKFKGILVEDIDNETLCISNANYDLINYLKKFNFWRIPFF